MPSQGFKELSSTLVNPYHGIMPTIPSQGFKELSSTLVNPYHGIMPTIAPAGILREGSLTPIGFEPPTSQLVGTRPYQLSQVPVMILFVGK